MLERSGKYKETIQLTQAGVSLKARHQGIDGL